MAASGVLTDADENRYFLCVSASTRLMGCWDFAFVWMAVVAHSSREVSFERRQNLFRMFSMR